MTRSAENSTATAAFDRAFAACPLVAILRGLTPDDAIAIGNAIVTAGFRILEVPLNSPDPLESIARLARHFADRFPAGEVVVGAGTVIDPADVARIGQAGGTLIVSPHFDADVVGAACDQGMVAVPGIATPSEAFGALKAGAAALKLFPAEAASPKVLSAMRAVLPSAARVLPVGGIAPDNMAPWRTAGAAGFGLGSALYKPGATPETTAANAASFIAALAAQG